MSLSACFGNLKNHKFFLLFIFVFSAVLRLGALLLYFQYNPCMTMFDSGHYHALGLSLTNGFGFVGADGAAYLYRLPGYPFFLALCYFCVGIKPVFALAIQGVVASFIPVLIFLLTRILFPAALVVAYASSFLASVHVGYLIYANLLMAETIFSIFFLLFHIFFLSKRLFLAGLMLGIASLIRPVGHYVLIVALAILLLAVNYLLKDRLKNMLALFTGWLAVVGWWLLRNYLLTGMLIFHTLSGPHFLNHSAVRLAMANNHLSYIQAKEQVQEATNQALKIAQSLQKEPLNQVQESAVMEKIALHYFNQNWTHAFKHCFINIFKTTFSLYSSNSVVSYRHMMNIEVYYQ